MIAIEHAPLGAVMLRIQMSIPETQADSSRGLILIVEDDESIRSFVELALDTEGYQVLTADNGVVALDVAGRRRPDLILLDMLMPVMDGWAFARAYRSQSGPHAPIIVITAAPNAGQRAAEIRADGYLGKPFNLDELLALVGQYTRAP